MNESIRTESLDWKPGSQGVTLLGAAFSANTGSTGRDPQVPTPPTPQPQSGAEVRRG